MNFHIIKFFFICLLFFSENLYAQPIITLSKCFGGSSNEAAFSIVERNNPQTLLVVGSSSSNDGDVQANYGMVDTWIINIDTLGQILWSANCGGSLNDIPEQIINTHDGGFAVLGYTISNQVYAAGNYCMNHGQEDIWIMKFSAAFSLQWQKCLGGLGSDVANHGKGIVETSSHEFIIIGSTQSNDSLVTGNHGGWDYFVSKLDFAGNILWQKCYGGTLSDIGFSAIETTDHDYALLGTSESNDGDVSGNHGNNDFWALKIDTNGSIIWQKCIGGSDNDYARCLTNTSDSSLVFAGSTQSIDGDIQNNHGGEDILLLKADLNGNTVWSKCYGGSNAEAINSIKIKADSTLLFCGYSNSSDGDLTSTHGFTVDAWVVNIDTASNLIWQRSMGGALDDLAFDISEDSHRNIWVANGSESVDGDVVSQHGNTGEFWIVRLDFNSANGIVNLVSNKITALYPNPFSYKATVITQHNLLQKNRIYLFDDNGSDCTNKIIIEKSDNKIELTNINLVPGIYYLYIPEISDNMKIPLLLIKN